MGIRETRVGGEPLRRVDLEQLSDNALALRAQEGDSEAGNVLLRRLYPMAASIAYGFRLPGDEWYSEYGVVFRECIKPGLFRPSRGSFRGYLRPGLVRAFTKLRSKRIIDSQHRARLDDLSPAAEARIVEQAGLSTSAITDITDVVERAIKDWRTARTRVREKQLWADIAERRYLHDQSPAQIAHLLGLTEKSVTNRLSKQINPTIRRELLRAGCDSDGGSRRTTPPRP